ncbi:hypothetical protein L861_09400 [Litchfieldella anticariensis FP35 = DSM 16096]|uniref:NlpC/P60 domain-containing protein n=1 Tax=Litchfieldella anticariensis (strain DSM 16096 / CECT 5854 / CIP 108499 / LMG 22089 / FP35) TaxID=1121939 RepID=S2L4A6_LITA3|nr:NlpC/P60 family protein [Halomonas anticariensis]EPC02549.1 hypothetical protein L861_09400 [Halomonas anticariensis FP35 = DSM 16096]
MLRVVGLCLMLALLAGCAGTSQKDNQSSAQSFSFNKSRTGVLPMSPVDNPIHEMNSFHTPPPAVIRRVLLAEHERWVGTPYRLGGEGFSGIDCSALMQNIFSERFRIDLPRSTSGQALQGRRIEREELKVGDLVFFRPPGPYRHVGVYVGDGYFLHASTSRGVKLSKLDNVYWRRYYWQSRRPMEQTQLAQRAARSWEG